MCSVRAHGAGSSGRVFVRLCRVFLILKPTGMGWGVTSLPHPFLSTERLNNAKFSGTPSRQVEIVLLS